MIDESKLQNGTIVSMRYTRSFGFLTPENRAGEEIFFHGTAVIPPEEFPSLRPGDAVTFMEVETKKGKRAVHVSKSSPVTPQKE